jgi:carboxyl-terminal processing protease
MKHRWSITLAIAALSFLSGGWLLQRGGQGGGFRDARLFDDVLDHVRRYYVDSLPEGELYGKATRGMLEQLHDPYSVLLAGEDYKELTEMTSGNYAGLGIQIDVRDGWITVVAPLPDTPAERAGIQTGDQIIEVDGKPTQGWNNEQAVKQLRGEAGSRVVIRVRRAGLDEPVRYELARATIHYRSVQPGTLFDGGVGFISLNPVAETSAQELKDEIATLRAKGMKALVLDLRNNPGGLLDQGVKVADLFLDPGQEVVSTRGRARGSTRQFLDDETQLDPGLPVVVLVSEGTASAAEITTVHSWWEHPPSGRAWSRPCTRWVMPRRSSSRRRAGTRRAAAPSSGWRGTRMNSSCSQPLRVAWCPTRWARGIRPSRRARSITPMRGGWCAVAVASYRT